MLTWISNSSFKLYDEKIIAPMITEDGLFIEYYQETPLYHNLIKHQIDISKSKPSAINNFNINSDYYILTFTCPQINEIELLWVKRLVSIILFKLNYNIVNINHEMENDYIRLIPLVFIKPLHNVGFSENIYVNNNIKINIDELIGYKPLIDLYEYTASLEIASSDLIWACDLSPYSYDILYDIPVIKINQLDELKARHTEFSMNPLLSLQSNVYFLSKNTFSYSKIPDDMIKKYNFKVIEQYDHYFLQHNIFDKYWLDKKSPVALISGDWVSILQPTIKNLAYLKYIAIRAYVDLFKNNINNINNIKIGFDLAIEIPINNYDDIEKLKNKINVMMIKYKPYVFIGDKDEIIINYISSNISNNGVFLGFPIYDKWVLVGNQPIIKNNINYQFDMPNIIGLYDYHLPKKLQKEFKTTKIKGLIDNIPYS